MLVEQPRELNRRALFKTFPPSLKPCFLFSVWWRCALDRSATFDCVVHCLLLFLLFLV